MKHIKTACHRNGISGAPFYVSIFEEEGRKMLGVRFVGDDISTDIHTAVFDLNLLANGVIEFGENSWRGDNYVDWLRSQQENWDRDRMTEYLEAQSARE